MSRDSRTPLCAKVLTLALALVFTASCTDSPTADTPGIAASVTGNRIVKPGPMVEALPVLKPGGAIPVAKPGGDLPEIPTELRPAGGPGGVASGDDAQAVGHARHILLQNTVTGVRAVWVISNGVIVNGVTIGSLGIEWNIAGAGDFNSDGFEDVVLENTTTGQRAIWLMNGLAQVTAVINLGNVTVDWRIAGAGDFNSDGKQDLLWQRLGAPGVGERALWLMNGGTVLQSVPLGTIPTAWRMVAGNDLSSDGRDDIFIENTTTGDRVVWAMVNGAVSFSVGLGNIPTVWSSGGVGDVNGDGLDDLFWDNTTTGLRAAWLLNGVLVVTGAPSLTVEIPQWQSRAILIPSNATNPCAPGGATGIAVGQTIGGTLAISDCILAPPGNKFVDYYSLTLASLTDVQIELSGTGGFNPLLQLANSTNGTVLATNDDFIPLFNNGRSHSRIRMQLAAGTYILRSTSSVASAVGSYAIRVCNSTPTPILLGQNLPGSLATTDCDVGDATLFDRFSFTLAFPTTITATLNSAAFVPWLIILNGTETPPVVGQTGGANPAGLSGLLPAGNYVAYANSFAAGATGAYTFQLTGVVNKCDEFTAITATQTLPGTIDGTDCLLADGTRADRFQIVLAAPTYLRIDLTSAAFDAFLFMRNASNANVAADDDGAGGTNSRIEGTFPAGTYIIYANTFAVGGAGAYSITTSTPAAGALNLEIDRAYLVQAPQSISGGVPLVAGRDAYLRVFVRANIANAVTPRVRARIYNAAGTLVNTYLIAAPGASVPTNLNEGTLTSSWNQLIPASEIVTSAKIDLMVDDNTLIAESNEGDNVWPPGGGVKTLDVRTTANLMIRMVPVTNGGNVSTLTAGNMNSYMAMSRKIWPFVSIIPDIRAVYTTTAGLLLSDGTNWGAVLAEMKVLRLAEAPLRHYYGVVNTPYALTTGGVAGIGNFAEAQAVGWQFLPSADQIAAHELGHNFNRAHSPCGGAAGPDPNYPYPAGNIGVFGLDVGTLAVKTPAQFDIMTYCDQTNQWISDYTYTNALTYILANPTADPPPPEASTMIWGRVENGQVILEPSFDLIASPTPLRTTGQYRIRATDASGRTTFEMPFTPEEVSDTKTPSYNFAFVIPKARLGGAAFASLNVSGPAGANVSRVSSGGAGANAAMLASPISAGRASSGGTEVRWNAAQYPLAVVRSVATGEILSLARGGVVTVANAETEIEVVLSDGVRSATKRIRRQ